MLLQLARRLLTEVDGRTLARVGRTGILGGMGAMRRFYQRKARGDVFPPVLFISVTTKCNLRCRGCWVCVEGKGASLDPSDLDRIIRQAKRRGNTVFGILGGEPLLYPPLWDVLSRHRDCLFQVFTNGTLLTDETAGTMRRLGNVTPLVSIEGFEATSDERRGGRNVYRRALAGLEHCRRNRLLTGVATSVCRSNFDELVTERHLRNLIERGVHYVWYYIYRPVGADPAPDLVLDGSQVRALRRFTVDARRWAPILIVDAYWDADGRALCPAVAGISCHVNPWGDVEPCPVVQFSGDRAVKGRDLYRTVRDSTFLAAFRDVAGRATRGCILMERPDLTRRLVVEQGARDSSGRGTGLQQLAAACPCNSHHVPGEEIPERHWLYRLAKKHWFAGFGTYG